MNEHYLIRMNYPRISTAGKFFNHSKLCKIYFYSNYLHSKIKTQTDHQAPLKEEYNLPPYLPLVLSLHYGSFFLAFLSFGSHAVLELSILPFPPSCYCASICFLTWLPIRIENIQLIICDLMLSSII